MALATLPLGLQRLCGVGWVDNAIQHADGQTKTQTESPEQFHIGQIQDYKALLQTP